MNQSIKVKEPEIIDEQFDNGELIMGVATIALLASVFLIGGTIATGVITGLFAAVGFGFLLYKTRKYKPKVWNTMMDHPIMTDIGLSAGAILLIAPTTLGGLVAGISCGVFASAGISFANKFLGKVKGISSYKLGLPNIKKFNTNLGNAASI